MNAGFRVYLVQAFISLCFLNTSAYSDSVAWYDEGTPFLRTYVCCSVRYKDRDSRSMVWIDASDVFVRSYDKSYHQSVCREYYYFPGQGEASNECNKRSLRVPEGKTLPEEFQGRPYSFHN